MEDNENVRYFVSGISVVNDIDAAVVLKDAEWSIGRRQTFLVSTVYLSEMYKEVRWHISANFGVENSTYAACVCFTVSDFDKHIYPVDARPKIVKFGLMVDSEYKRLYSVPYDLYHKTENTAIDIVRGMLIAKGGFSWLGTPLLMFPNHKVWDVYGDKKNIVKEFKIV